MAHASESAALNANVGDSTDKLRTKENLLRAGQKLIAEGGFSAVTVRRATSMVGLSPAAIYTYFDSMDCYSTELFQLIAGREFAFVEQAVLSEEGDASAKVRTLVHAFSRRALQGLTTAHALLFEPVCPQVEEARIAFRRKYHDLVHTIIVEGNNSDSSSPHETAVMSRAVIGAIAEGLMGNLSPELSSPSSEDTTNTIAEFCVRAIGGKS